MTILPSIRREVSITTGRRVVLLILTPSTLNPSHKFSISFSAFSLNTFSAIFLSSVLRSAIIWLSGVNLKPFVGSLCSFHSVFKILDQPISAIKIGAK